MGLGFGDCGARSFADWPTGLCNMGLSPGALLVQQYLAHSGGPTACAPEQSIISSGCEGQHRMTDGGNSCELFSTQYLDQHTYFTASDLYARCCRERICSIEVLQAEAFGENLHRYGFRSVAFETCTDPSIEVHCIMVWQSSLKFACHAMIFMMEMEDLLYLYPPMMVYALQT